MTTHAGQPGRMQAFEEIVRRRYSCRAFTGEGLQGETVERLLAMAQQAPSWCNVQPWHVYVVSGQAVAQLSARLLAPAESLTQDYDIEIPKEYTGVFKDRRQASGLALYKSVGIERGQNEKRLQQHLDNYRFFGAPHVAVITCDLSLGPYAYVDTGVYMSHFTLAAASLGIDTIAQASIAGRAGVVRSALDIPQEQVIVGAISFGYGAGDHPANAFRTTRAGKEESSTWVETLS